MLRGSGACEKWGDFVGPHSPGIRRPTLKGLDRKFEPYDSVNLRRLGSRGWMRAGGRQRSFGLRLQDHSASGAERNPELRSVFTDLFSFLFLAV